MSSNDDSSDGKLARQIGTVEEAIKLLTEAALRADERRDELEAAQANSERKLAALADAQIRTEEALARLADQQAHSDQRLDALIDIVRTMRDGDSTR